MDCAQVSFIADDKLVISLKGGELYVLTLFADSMRSVRSFHFDKAASSVLTTCVSNLLNYFQFLNLNFHESSANSFIDHDEDKNSEKRIFFKSLYFLNKSREKTCIYVNNFSPEEATVHSETFSLD